MRELQETGRPTWLSLWESWRRRRLRGRRRVWGCSDGKDGAEPAKQSCPLRHSSVELCHLPQRGRQGGEEATAFCQTKKILKTCKFTLTNRAGFGIIHLASGEYSGQTWEHSSAGRAHALQAWGHRFEPCCSHHQYGAVVQLVRTPACHAGGRGFKSLPRRHICPGSSVGRAAD